VTPSHQYVDHIQNVLNIRDSAVLPQRANGNSVTAVAIVAAEADVCCWAVDRQAIVRVIDGVVLEQYIRPIRVEGYRMASEPVTTTPY